MHHLLSAGDLSLSEITEILDLAEEMSPVQSRPVKKLPALRGRTVVNLFFEDSTRTRSSFEIAGKWLSADVINVVGQGLVGLQGRVAAGHRDDRGRDGRGRPGHPAHGLRRAVADHRLVRRLASTPTSSTPGTAPTSTRPRPCWTRSPCAGTSALADGGDFAGRTVAIVGDLTHSRVARSNVLLLATLGAKVVLVAPPTLMPSGVGSWPVDGQTDLDAVLPAVDAVMMLRVQRERMCGGYFPTPREYTVGYGLTRNRLCALRPGTAICHPGPMNRGLEISAEAADAASLAGAQPGRRGGRRADGGALPAAGRGRRDADDRVGGGRVSGRTGADLVGAGRRRPVRPRRHVRRPRRGRRRRRSGSTPTGWSRCRAWSTCTPTCASRAGRTRRRSRTGTQAAARGGYTAVLAMANTARSPTPPRRPSTSGPSAAATARPR